MGPSLRADRPTPQRLNWTSPHFVGNLHPRDVDPQRVRELADEVYVHLVSEGREQSPELAEEALRRAAQAVSDAASWEAIWERSVR